MNIQVMNRSNAVHFTYNTKTKNHYFMISISDKYEVSPRFHHDPDCLGFCYLNFDDVEVGEKNCIAKSDVDILERFLKSAFKKHPHVENIIVHCGAGVSRSSGLAAALMKYYNNNDFPIFDNPKYSPNMTVYRMVLNRLMGSIVEKEVKEKEEHNIKLWKEANDLED